MKKKFHKEEAAHMPACNPLEPEETEPVTGGRSGGKYYNDYCILWKKVKGACMNHGYRTACCPRCGTPLPDLGHYGDYDEFECKYATQNKLYCRNCHEASRSEDWVVNRFN